MKSMNKSWMFLGLASALILGANAHAAKDNWAGTQVGIELGNARTNTDIGDLDDYTDNQQVNGLTDSASLKGGFVNYSLQKGSLVYGLELGMSLTGNKDISDWGDTTNATYQGGLELNSIMSVKLRTGVAVDNSLIYVAAGPAWGKAEFTFQDTTTFSDKTKLKGYAFAVGVESKLTSHLVGRLQGETVNFRNKKFNDNIHSTPFSAVTSVFNISAGLAYKF